MFCAKMLFMQKKYTKKKQSLRKFSICSFVILGSIHTKSKSKIKERETVRSNVESKNFSKTF